MYERFAIFYTPIGALARWGAAWLGWDSATGEPVAHPPMSALDLPDITQGPRAYGLHATLKAPFRLAPGTTATALEAALHDFAHTQRPVLLGPLTLSARGGFVVLRPAGPTPETNRLAADIVRHFDPYRAPLTPHDLARRRQASLSPRQDEQLKTWGYPFVFEDFHLHITLTRSLSQAQAEKVIAELRPGIGATLTNPTQIDAITLMGQGADGLFRQIRRAPLGP